MNKYKESTGRVVMFKEFGIVNSYTLECSMCGPSLGSKKDFHYSKKMLFVSGVHEMILAVGYWQESLPNTLWYDWFRQMQSCNEGDLVQICSSIISKSKFNDSSSWANRFQKGLGARITNYIIRDATTCRSQNQNWNSSQDLEEPTLASMFRGLVLGVPSLILEFLAFKANHWLSTRSDYSSKSNWR